jgi:hypothetical protein|tara:strand:+ start:23 stop:493 length:471 start_codon:yes stop_codon:yes gene_type:complete
MKKLSIVVASLILIGLSSCGVGGKKIFGGIIPASNPVVIEEKQSIMDLFQNKQDSNTAISVNKYIWIAALDVLSFLPIEAADPFTGVISFGYGKAPGSNTAYRGTVLINDPALDARSLKVTLISNGTVPLDSKTVREVENAILTRARQIYLEQKKL